MNHGAARIRAALQMNASRKNVAGNGNGAGAPPDGLMAAMLPINLSIRSAIVPALTSEKTQKAIVPVCAHGFIDHKPIPRAASITAVAT